MSLTEKNIREKMKLEEVKYSASNDESSWWPEKFSLEFLKRSSRTSREIENESCAGSASSQKEIFRDRPRRTDYDWKFTYTILITYFFATLFPKNKNKICEDCAICIKLTKRSEKSRAMDIFLLYAQSAYLPRIQFPVVIRVLAS